MIAYSCFLDVIYNFDIRLINEDTKNNILILLTSPTGFPLPLPFEDVSPVFVFEPKPFEGAVTTAGTAP